MFIAGAALLDHLTAYSTRHVNMLLEGRAAQNNWQMPVCIVLTTGTI